MRTEIQQQARLIGEAWKEHDELDALPDRKREANFVTEHVIPDFVSKIAICDVRDRSDALIVAAILADHLDALRRNYPNDVKLAEAEAMTLELLRYQLATNGQDPEALGVRAYTCHADQRSAHVRAELLQRKSRKCPMDGLFFGLMTDRQLKEEGLHRFTIEQMENRRSELQQCLSLAGEHREQALRLIEGIEIAMMHTEPTSVREAAVLQDLAIKSDCTEEQKARITAAVGRFLAKVSGLSTEGQESAT